MTFQPTASKLENEKNVSLFSPANGRKIKISENYVN